MKNTLYIKKIGNKLHSSGFTIVEALMAITILVSSVTAPLVIYSNSISSAILARDRIVASYLAQEAVEYVLYEVGTKLNAGDDEWLGSLSACTNGTPCTIDTKSATAISSCTQGGECLELRFDPIKNEYTHSDSSIISVKSKYDREVQVLVNPSGQNPSEALITAEVFWDTGTRQNSFILESHVYKWR